MNQATQTLNNLTIADLESLIETIIKRTLIQEKVNNNNQKKLLLSTFGTWEDQQTDEEIIKQIYHSRNSNL